MKTTLKLNDQLPAAAKALAAQQRTSLTRLIEEGLQIRLRAKAGSAKRARVRLPVFKGRGGLVDGVDPLSNKALLEALGDDSRLRQVCNSLHWARSGRSCDSCALTSNWAETTCPMRGCRPPWRTAVNTL